VRDYAFFGVKLPRVISLIRPENIPSRRVAEKIGLTPEKQITFHGFPTTVFALSRKCWLAQCDAR
jgi:[ribosomal protein S5]-alanine N-acetyltransferase